MSFLQHPRTTVLLLSLLLFLGGSFIPAAIEAADPAESEAPMPTGLRLLNQASAAQMNGDFSGAKDLTRAAIAAAPRLGAARSVMGGMLMQDGNFRAAEKEFAAAVALIEEPDQPPLLLPFWGPAVIEPEELAGDAYATWGLCFLELAKATQSAGDRAQEATLLKKAKSAFTEALKRKPSPEMGAMAKDMLARFNF